MAMFVTPEMGRWAAEYAAQTEYTDSMQSTTLIDDICSVVKPILDSIAACFTSTSPTEEPIPNCLSSYSTLQKVFSESDAIPRIISRRNQALPPENLPFDDIFDLLSPNQVNHVHPELKSAVANIAFSKSSVREGRISSRLISNEDTGMVSFVFQGYCRGLSDWFIYLYLRTRNYFFNSETQEYDHKAHFAAIWEEFSGGAKEEAVLLQALRTGKGKLLGLKIGTQPICSKWTSPLSHSSVREPSLRIDYSKWVDLRGSYDSADQIAIATKDFNETISEIEKLENGVYFVNNHNHAMVYVKIEKDLGYFFNSSQGIKEINGPQGDVLHKLIPVSGFLNPDGSWVCDREFLKIEFTPVTLRT